MKRTGLSTWLIALEGEDRNERASNQNSPHGNRNRRSHGCHILVHDVAFSFVGFSAWPVRMVLRDLLLLHDGEVLLKRLLCVMAVLVTCSGCEVGNPGVPVAYQDAVPYTETLIDDSPRAPVTHLLTLTYEGKRHVFLRSFLSGAGCHIVKVGEYPVEGEKRP